jgi:hypothetical protein
MLQLIHSNRNMRGPINQNVYSHKNGICIETHAAVLVGFLFVLYHCVEPVLGTQTAKDPCELEVSRTLRLNE